MSYQNHSLFFKETSFVVCVILLSFLSTALAQIGQPADLLLKQLNSYNIEKSANGYSTDEDFSFALEERSGVVYSLIGNGSLTQNNINFVSDLVATTTDFGEDISTAIKTFLTDRVGELSGAGATSLPIEQFTWNVTVTGETEPYKLEFSLSLDELPADTFPLADHIMGAADAKYVIREFSDFQCPYCEQFFVGAYLDIKEQLLTRGDVRLEFHHFPLVSIHPNAQPAAEAAECIVAANNPEAFWTFHDALFERQQAWSDLPDASSYFVRLAQDVDLKIEGVAQCIADRTYKSKVVASYRAGGKLGIEGTPTLFVNGFKVGDYTQIESYLALMDLVDKFSE